MTKITRRDVRLFTWRNRSLTCRDDRKMPLVNASFTDDSTINTTMHINIHIRLTFARENRVWLGRFEPATSHSLREVCEVRHGSSVDRVPVVRRIRHDGRSLSFRRGSLRYGVESAVTRHRLVSRTTRARKRSRVFVTRTKIDAPTTPRSSPSPDRSAKRFRLTAATALAMSRYRAANAHARRHASRRQRHYRLSLSPFIDRG